MAMLTMEQVLSELEGLDEQGRPTLLSAADLEHVRMHFPDYAFAYSKKDGGRTMCSGCGEELERNGERHKDWIRCPRCRKDVRVWEEWRGHKYLYEQNVTYIWARSKSDPETILAKAIHATKSMGCSFPELAGLNAKVDAVYQFGPKGARMYRRGYYSNGYTANASSVTAEENKHSYGCDAVHCGFWEAAEGTTLGYVVGELGVRLTTSQYYAGAHPVAALTEAARKPYLKYVCMNGQKQLAKDIATGGLKVKKRTAKSMPELLGLTEGQWYEVRKNKLTLDARWLKALWAIQAAGSMTISLKEAWTAVEQNSEHQRQRLLDTSQKLLSRCTPKLRRKAVRRAGFSHDLTEWVDYWNQLDELGEDLTDSRLLLPKDLHAMHQRMTDRLAAIKQEQAARLDEGKRKSFDERLRKLKKLYTFEACGLVLRPFETAQEVIAEGTAQHICIGGYAERYMKGETILCALRRTEAPEEPWRAIEFSAMTGLMVQDRGKYNDRGCGAANKINGVEAWLRRFWRAFDAYYETQKIGKAGKAA